MDEIERTAEEAKRLFAETIANPATPPVEPRTVVVPHPAKPCVKVAVPPSEVAEVRRSLSKRERDAREAEALEAEREAHRQAAEDGDFGDVWVTDDGGRRAVNTSDLHEYAARRFKALFVD